MHWLRCSRSRDNAAMFDRSARWYDAFYGTLDYEGEADTLTGIIRGLNPQARSLLDVACGTGRHLAWFQHHFQCVGVDIERHMLAVARRRLPGVPLETADMLNLDLGRRFDAITCLFSSIGYAALPDRLDQAVARMAGHLQPDGVLVIEPWITPPAWVGSGSESVDVVDHDGGKLVRVISSRRQGDQTILRMHYVHAARGSIETEDERHRLGLFSRDQYLAALRTAGLTATWHDPGLRGRGLVVGQAERA